MKTTDQFLAAWKAFAVSLQPSVYSAALPVSHPPPALSAVGQNLRYSALSAQQLRLNRDFLEGGGTDLVVAQMPTENSTQQIPRAADG